MSDCVTVRSIMGSCSWVRCICLTNSCHQEGADKLKEYASRREMGSEMKETKGGHVSRDRTEGKWV